MSNDKLHDSASDPPDSHHQPGNVGNSTEGSDFTLSVCGSAMANDLNKLPATKRRGGRRVGGLLPTALGGRIPNTRCSYQPDRNLHLHLRGINLVCWNAQTGSIDSARLDVDVKPVFCSRGGEVHPRDTLMRIDSLISYCCPMFGLLMGVFVLTRTNPPQLAYSAARPVTLSRPYLTQVQAHPDENHRDMFQRRLN